MASISDLVKHYQHAIEKYPNDEQKILKSIDKLFNLGVTVQHLQETGVGRTVNALRKEPGDVGTAARALVYKWKLMVAAEESDHEEDHNQPTTYNGHENGKTPEDSDYETKNRHNQHDNMDRIEGEKTYSNSNYMNGDYTGGKRKHRSSEEEEPYIKKSRHITQNEAPEKMPHMTVKKEELYIKKSRHITQNEAPVITMKKEHITVKKEQSETEPDSATSHSDEDGESDSRNSESCEEKSSRYKSKTEHKRLSSPKQSISQDKHKHDSSSSGNSHKHAERHSKHSSSESKHITEKSSKDYKSSSSDKHRKEKESSSQKREKSDHKSDDKEKNKKESREESSSRHRSSSEKHKSSNHSDKSKSHSEKSSSKSEKHSSSSHKEKSEKDKHKHLSEKSSDKHKSKDKEHSSSKDKHHVSSKEKAKDKDSSSKDKEYSHKSDKKHSSSSDISAKENISKSKSEKTDEHKRSSDSKEKKSSSKSSHSSKSSKSSSSSKSKDIPKKKSQKETIEDGIDCGSGASFAEALGMISPTKPKKKSAFTKDTSYSPNNSGSNDDLTPAALLAPNVQLAPLPTLEISALPEISPNYKPRPPPKFLPHFTDDDAISAGISSKNQRTKVYSGNKVLGKIPTLYEMCVQILQEHIDALEYTGGVPYEILKPIVDKATPQQLYMLEHFNSYLMEDTDHLWQKFCEKNFRNKKRQELESWREMFIRCQEEQENRLKSLTANIRIAQEAKKAPIKQTKMAYVDTIVKPPRSVARKQAQHGTAFAASASPAARVAALAAAPNVLKGSARPAPIITVPSGTFQKPKKAPLMQKALQFMRGRKR